MPSRPPVVQGGGSGAKTTVFVGLSTGEGPIDAGIVGSVSFEFEIADAPVNVRIDPYLALHGGDCGVYDCSANIFGVGGAAAYDFPTSGAGSPVWYVFGGLGLYRSQFDVDDGFPGRNNHSSTDLGLQLGGGAHFGERFTGEIRWLDVDGWDPLVFLFGWRLGR